MNKGKSYYWFAACIVLAVLAVSCIKDADETPTPSYEQLIQTDVVYGSHARQRMDVYLPEGRDEKTPIVLMIHGGAWVAGNKGDFNETQQNLLNEKIGTISINYRYASANHHFEGLMADVALALAAVKENAIEWGIRKEKYQLLGGSAGGHMAMLYAYHYQQNNEVSSVISLAGPTSVSEEFISELPNTELKLAVEAMVGAPLIPPFSERFTLASPMTYVNTAVPTLLIHGTADDIVPFNQSTGLEAALKAQGKTVKLLPLENVGHDFSGNPIAALQAVVEALAWIKDHD